MVTIRWRVLGLIVVGMIPAMLWTLYGLRLVLGAGLDSVSASLIAALVGVLFGALAALLIITYGFDYGLDR